MANRIKNRVLAFCLVLYCVCLEHSFVVQGGMGLLQLFDAEDGRFVQLYSIDGIVVLSEKTAEHNNVNKVAAL